MDIRRRPTSSPSCAGSSGPIANGLAVFDTIYPGWYPGRAVHIHVKVHVGGSVVHTGQLFFSDDLTDAVYQPRALREPGHRATRATRTTRSIVNGGARGLLTVAKTGTGYTGRIVMGVMAA